MPSRGFDQADLFLRAADHAVAFRDGVDARAQRPELSYREALRVFEAPTPENGIGAAAAIDELVQRAEKGLAAMTGPRFFGWVTSCSHPVGVAADWLTSAWGQNVGNHAAAPAAAAVETVSARWLLDLLDLPREASLGFVSGATMANFTCLAAARSEVLRRLGWDVETDGLFGAPPIHVLIGEEAHSSVFAALQMLGLGRERVVRVAVDGEGRMDPSAFVGEIRRCPGP